MGRRRIKRRRKSEGGRRRKKRGEETGETGGKKRREDWEVGESVRGGGERKGRQEMETSPGQRQQEEKRVK